MIQKALVDILFRASHMKRWTDRVRPTDFTVLGKEAHAMSAAWFLGRAYEVETGEKLNWPLMVEAGLFSLLEKCVLSDIKSQVYDQLLEDVDAEKALTAHVLQTLKDPVGDVNRRMFERLEDYMKGGRQHQAGLEYEILRASSWLASDWEWRLIQGWGDQTVFSIENPRDSLDEDFPAVEKWARKLRRGHDDENPDLSSAWDLCGRLRFQDRWTQTPVIPRRTVIDHEMVVGCLAYMAFMDVLPSEWDKPSSDDNPIPPKATRAANDFFVGLFHDMAEATTRDIIAPVKGISPSVAKRIDGLERAYFDDKLGPLLDDADWRTEFESYVLKPFNENTDSYNGRTIKGCDVFAAFMEAYYSIKCGTYSPWLRNALLHMFEHRRQYSPRSMATGGGVVFNGIDFEVVYELCFHDVEIELRRIT